MKPRKSMEFLQQLLVPAHRNRLQPKSWGFEYWFENNDQYCGKILQVRGDEWSSYGAFHYHNKKDETFLVMSGTLILDILDLSRVSKSLIGIDNRIYSSNEAAITVHRFYMKPFDYIRLKPGVLHRFSALGFEAMFTETSTTHMEYDSYRISTPEAHEQLDFNSIGKYNLADRQIDTKKYSYLKDVWEG